MSKLVMCEVDYVTPDNILFGDETLTEMIERIVEKQMFSFSAITGLNPGDILHVKLGIEDMGDDQPPWIPTRNELEYAQQEFELVVPDGVRVIATHIGYDVSAIEEGQNIYE